jgi:hypothetical protein
MKPTGPWFICKASWFGHVPSENNFFLIQLKPKVVQTLIRLMEAARTLRRQNPEVVSMKGYLDGPTFFFAPPDGMMSTLREACPDDPFDATFMCGYCQIPAAFQFKMDYKDQPVGALKIRPPGLIDMLVSDDGIYFTGEQDQTGVELISEHLSYEFVVDYYTKTLKP